MSLNQSRLVDLRLEMWKRRATVDRSVSYEGSTQFTIKRYSNPRDIPSSFQNPPHGRYRTQESRGECRPTYQQYTQCNHHESGRIVREYNASLDYSYLQRLNPTPPPQYHLTNKHGVITFGFGIPQLAPANSSFLDRKDPLPSADDR